MRPVVGKGLGRPRAQGVTVGPGLTGKDANPPRWRPRPHAWRVSLPPPTHRLPERVLLSKCHCTPGEPPHRPLRAPGSQRVPRRAGRGDFPRTTLPSWPFPVARAPPPGTAARLYVGLAAGAPVWPSRNPRDRWIDPFLGWSAERRRGARAWPQPPQPRLTTCSSRPSLQLLPEGVQG